MKQFVPNPLSCFQFREQVHKFVLKSPCFKEEKKGLETCHKSQSFFNGINLMPSVSTGGAEKSQTMSTAVTDTNQRVSSDFSGATGGFNSILS